VSIRFNCDCGKVLSAPDGSGGRRGKCPACDRIFTVPTPVQPVPVIPAEPDDLFGFADSTPAPPPPVRSRLQMTTAPSPSRRTTPRPAESLTRRARYLGQPVKKPDPLPEPVGSTGRSYRYLFLLLALLPLVWSTVRPEPHVSRVDQVVQTVKNHPELYKKAGKDKVGEHDSDDQEDEKSSEKNVTWSQVMSNLPDDKCDGALFAYDTWAHWGFAVLSGAGFFGLIMLLFPPGHTKVWHLLVTGAFTGTLGIVLLLAFQWLAFHMPLFTPRGILSLILFLVWCIGQSYSLALGDHGFILSALGFTAGVGFCEEACKALPLIWKARVTGFASWRSAMIWGLISGIGFGVSEAITYSHDYYNGFMGGQIYLVRFISCVALHGIWAAAVGINVFRRQDHLRGDMHVLEWIQQIAITVIVPMVLHGMYDTLLKEDLDWAALLIAFISFGWLAYQVEMAKKRYDLAAG
jgi:hypothetical protein